MTEELLAEYMERDLPVYFLAQPADNNGEFVRMCEKQHLLDHYGDHRVVLSSSNAHSYVAVGEFAHVFRQRGLRTSRNHSRA